MSRRNQSSPVTSIFISIALTFIAEFTMRLGGLRVDGKSTHLLAHTLHSPICWQLINALKLGLNTFSPAYPTRFVSVPKVALREWVKGENFCLSSWMELST